MDSKIRMRWTADKMTLLKVDYIEKKKKSRKKVSYELSGCGFMSRCSHLTKRYRTCFEEAVP